MPGGISKSKKRAKPKAKKTIKTRSGRGGKGNSIATEPATDNPTASTTVPPRASLLGLAGELRNRIYRLTLITSGEDHRIKISPMSHDQPALLKTCRQIRSEALKICEAENLFAVDVVNLCPIIPQRAHWAHRVDYALIFVRPSKMIFSNLKEWIKAHLVGNVRRLVGWQSSETLSKQSKILLQAFELASDLRAGSTQVSWQMVEGALEKWKETVVTLDPTIWADESDEMQ